MTPPDRPAALRAEGVSVIAGGRALVREVSLEVAPGEVVVLAGPNGAGKSTLLRVFYRALRATSGRVTLDGDDVWRMPGRRLARRLAAVPQEAPGEFELTVYEVAAMGRTPHKRAFEGDDAADRRVVMGALEDLDVAGLARAPFDRLSGGEKQRVLIARALAQRAGTMVLDEPTNHLDLRSQFEIIDLVRTLDITIVAALHDLNLAARVSSRIIVMKGGRIAGHGAPAEVLTQELISDVFGVHAEVFTHPVRGHQVIDLLPPHALERAM